jgi:hypothetical protein
MTLLESGVVFDGRPALSGGSPNVRSWQIFPLTRS